MKEDEIVAVINFTIDDVSYIVPVDNWNAAVEEGRTMPVILGDELHFVTPEDYKKIENAQYMIKPNKLII